MRTHDLIVIGGGTAGLVTAFGAAAIGARVALVERSRTGGDCLWTGCVPSKSLIAAGARAHAMRTADSVGLTPVEPEIDFAAVMAHVRGAQATIAPHDSPERLRAAGVEMIEAHASFTGPRRLSAGGRELRARSVVIATGSEPALPPVAGLETAGALTSDEVWELEELPRRLVILGGGPIGCELGQAFARLGSEVTIVEFERRLLSREEPWAADIVATTLAGEGVDLRLGWKATAARPGALEIEREGVSETLEFDKLVVATGRRPRTAGLALERAGVELSDRGAVIVDDRLRTSARGVFAAGDVTGGPPFTHVAAHHARIVVTNALLLTRRKVEENAIPRVTFTEPEVASVGISHAAARERHGDGVKSVRFDYTALDRAITQGDTVGAAALVGDGRGKLLGATIVAAGAGETLAEVTSVLRRGGRIDEISQTIHAYPTLAEGPSRAADEHLRAKYFNDRVRRVVRPVLAVLRAIDRPR